MTSITCIASFSASSTFTVLSTFIHTLAVPDAFYCGRLYSLVAHGAWLLHFEALSVIPLTLGIGYYGLFGFVKTCSTVPYVFLILLSTYSFHILRHFAQHTIFLTSHIIFTRVTVTNITVHKADSPRLNEFNDTSLNTVSFRSFKLQ